MGLFCERITQMWLFCNTFVVSGVQSGIGKRGADDEAPGAEDDRRL